MGPKHRPFRASALSMLSHIARVVGINGTRANRHTRQLATAAQRSIDADIAALIEARDGGFTVSDQFVDAIVASVKSESRVFTTGMGKSGSVAQRMAISLSSTGTPSQWVHASEWMHGDLGAVRAGDTIVAFSHSGRSAEIEAAIPFFKSRRANVLAVVGREGSPLAEASDACVVAPAGNEILGLVPSRSIVVQEAVINAVISEVVERLGFSEKDFAHNHPGGSIGKATASEREGPI